MVSKLILWLGILSMGTAHPLHAQDTLVDPTDAHVLLFTPIDKESLIENSTVNFDVSSILILSRIDSIHYVFRLTVNGKPYPPFEFRTLPLSDGAVGGTSQVMTWFVKIPKHRKMKAQLIIDGKSFVGRKQYEFANTVRNYSVTCSGTNAISRTFGRLLHQCY